MSGGKQSRLPEVLFEIGKAIGSEDGVAALMSHISERVCALVGADACSIMLLDAGRERLLTKAAYGLPPDAVRAISFRIGEGVAGWVVARGEAALIVDTELDARFVPRPGGAPHRAMLCVPLVAHGVPIGAMTATALAPGVFDESDREALMLIATTIALDLENVRLRKLAVTDALTGIYNREYLQQQLPRELELAVQRGLPLAVAMADLDDFKAVNDSHGHEVGDRVLREVADRMRGAIRAGDALVRYGGEEFLALLPNADVERGREIGERMRRRLSEQPVAVDALQIGVAASFGVAQLRPGESAADLLRRADGALYAAKRRGRNCVEVAP